MRYDMNNREIRKRIRDYFGEVPNRTEIGRMNGKPLIDIEYEDFHSEPRVKAELRQIVGQDVYLNVKRNCSKTLMQQVYCLLYGNIDDLRFHLMETVEQT